jgi:hypothetical protein
VRSVLISALVGCTEGPLQARSRRFLQGLSSDELEFIAEYLGSCILESAGTASQSRGELALRVAQFQAARAHALSADEEHKMILLLEFLCRAGVSDALRKRPS